MILYKVRKKLNQRNVNSYRENMQLYAYRINANQIQYIENNDLVQANCRTPFKHHPKGCPNYGKNWGCPPYAPSIEDTQGILNTYSYHWLIAMEIMIPKSGLKFFRKIKTKQKNSQVEKYINEFMDYLRANKPDWAVFYCSHCEVCKEKLYKGCICPAEPCRFPEKIRISPEAAGIDVFSTLQGIDVPYEINPKTKIQRVVLCATDEVVNFDQLHKDYKLYLRILRKMTEMS